MIFWAQLTEGNLQAALREVGSPEVVRLEVHPEDKFAALKLRSLQEFIEVAVNASLPRGTWNLLPTGEDAPRGNG